MAQENKMPPVTVFLTSQCSNTELFNKSELQKYILPFQDPSNKMDMQEDIVFLSRGTDTGLWRNLSNILGPLGEFSFTVRFLIVRNTKLES